jgi:hypothetical protein
VDELGGHGNRHDALELGCGAASQELDALG